MSHDHKKQWNRVNSPFLTNLVSAIVTTTQFVIRTGVDWTPLSERHGQSPPDCGHNTFGATTTTVEAIINHCGDMSKWSTAGTR